MDRQKDQIAALVLQDADGEGLEIVSNLKIENSRTAFLTENPKTGERWNVIITREITQSDEPSCNTALLTIDERELLRGAATALSNQWSENWIAKLRNMADR